MKNKHPVLRRFMRRKVSVVAAAVLILFVLIAILGPLVWQVDPLKQSVMKKYGPMTVQHPLGTDNLGRDTLARMIYGARVSLAISFAGVLSGALIGVLLGVSAGYFAAGSMRLSAGSSTSCWRSPVCCWRLPSSRCWDRVRSTPSLLLRYLPYRV